MIRVLANTSGLRTRFGAMRRLGPFGRAAALRANIGDRVRSWMAIAPKDTNRYVRGWAQAAMEIGAEGISMPPLKKSKYLEQYVEAFEFRIAGLAANLRQKEALLRDGSMVRGQKRPLSPSRRARTEKTVQSLRERIARERQRMRDLLAHDHAIVIGAGPIYSRDDGPFISLHRSWTKPTIRLRVYGGSGTMRTSGTVTIARLRNKEPHASIVQSRINLRTAMAVESLRRAKARYLAAVGGGRATGALRARLDLAAIRASRAAAVSGGLESFTK